MEDGEFLRELLVHYLHKGEEYGHLVAAVEHVPVESIINLILNTLVKGPGHFNLNTNYVLSYPELLSRLLVSLFPNDDSSEDWLGSDREKSNKVRAGVLRMMVAMMGKSHRNLIIAKQQELTSLLLAQVDKLEDSIVLGEVLSLVGQLCTFHCSEREGKHLLSLLRTSFYGDTWPRHSACLLRVLANMTRREGPAEFFDFNGQAGLPLGAFPKWPFSKGYSVSFWLRVESFVNLSGKAGHCPYLYCFRCKEGGGIEAHFDGPYLSLASFNKGKRQPVKFDYKFQPKKWYHITIAHRNISKWPLSFGQQSEALLYVNGTRTCVLPANFPSPMNLNLCFLGGNAEEVNNQFVGQIGPVLIADCAFLDNEVQTLYREDPSGTGFFDPHGEMAAIMQHCVMLCHPIEHAQQQHHCIAPDRVLIAVCRSFQDALVCMGGIEVLFPLIVQLNQEVEDQIPVNSGLAMFSAPVSHTDSGRSFFLGLSAPTGSPTPLSSSFYGEGHSPITPTTPTTTTTTATTTATTATQPLKVGVSSPPASSLGDGITGVFTPTTRGASVTPSPSTLMSYPLPPTPQEALSAESQIAPAVLWVFVECLRHHRTNQQDFLGCDGVRVLSYLLQTIAARNMSPHTVVVLCEMAEAVREIEEATESVPEKECLENMVLQLLFTIRVWVHSPYQTQKYLLQTLTSLSRERGPYFRRSVGVVGLLDIMRRFYWEDTPSSTAFTSVVRYHPTSGQVIGRRPAGMNLASLRLSLLELMMAIAPHNWSLVEASALVCFLQECTDTAQLSDVLHVLLELLVDQSAGPASAAASPAAYSGSSTASASPSSNITHAYAASGNSNGALPHFVHLRLELPLLCLLHTPDQLVQSLALKALVLFLIKAPSRHRARLEGQGGYSFLEAGLRAVAALTSTAAMTEDVYLTLLDLLVGRMDVNPLRWRPTSSFCARKHMALDGTQRFSNDLAVSLIFRLLSTASLLLKQQALQDFILLLSSSSDNRTTFMAAPDWCGWLFALFDNHLTVAEDCDKDDLELQVGSLFSLLMKVFTILFRHSFREKGGWKVMEQALLHLGLSGFRSSRIFLTMPKVCNELFTTAFEAIHAIAMEMDSGSGAVATVLRENYHVLAMLLEEFVFYDYPSSASLMSKSSSDSSWEDIGNAVDAMPSPDTGSPLTVFTRSRASTDNTDEIPTTTGSSKTTCFPGDRSGVAQDLHRDDEQKWEDKELVLLALSVLDSVSHLHCPPPPVNAEGFLTETNACARRCRSGGLLRIVVRFSLQLLSEEATPETIEEVCGRLRDVLHSIPDRASAANNTRNVAVFAFLYNLLAENSSVPADAAETPRRQWESHVLELAQLLRQLMRPPRGATLLSLLKDPQGIAIIADPLPSHFSDGALAQDVVRHLLSSRLATAVSSSAVVAVVHSATEEAAGFEATINRVWTSDTRQTRERMECSIEANRNLIAKLENDARTAGRESAVKEGPRRVQVARNDDLASTMGEQSWKSLRRSLSHERALWGAPRVMLQSTSGLPTTLPENHSLWKLDITEDKCRMRRKMKRGTADHVHLGTSGGLKIHRQSSADELQVLGLRPANPEEGTAAEITASSDGDHSSNNPTPPASPPSKSKAKHQHQHQQQPETTPEPGDFAVDNKVLLSVEAEYVTPFAVTRGTFEISSSYVYFYGDRAEEEKDTTHGRTKKKLIPLRDIVGLHGRRYILQPSAIEMALEGNVMLFFNFPVTAGSPQADPRMAVYKKLSSLCKLRVEYLSTAPQMVQKLRLTEEWQRRRISNFEYLMYLNTLAGRSYNDLTQYPVFPWVVADYTSSTLNLSKKSTFRDLSKPIGMQTPSVAAMLKDKYNTFVDPTMPPFHYGSHYSSAAAVLYYLIRGEPFTNLHIQLQSGNFDHADRLFDSVEQSWKSCSTASSGDVKELTPEFFYNPHFLLNLNKLSLGTKQDGTVLGDVKLPKWAPDVDTFIRTHRDALECEYVSNHLHLWIDLIFGYKQRGPAAAEAGNVFYYLTYEGAVDLSSITDPVQRQAAELQIVNFGQTPSQLFRRAHPVRQIGESFWVPVFHKPSIAKPFCPIQTGGDRDIAGEDVVVMQALPDRILTLSRSRYIGTHRWQPLKPEGGLPFTFVVDVSRERANSGGRRFSIGTRSEQAVLPVGTPFAQDLLSLAHCFAVIPDARIFVTAGHWDRSFKCTSADTGKVLQSCFSHQQVVTCVTLTEDRHYLVTGSRNATVMVWRLFEKKRKLPLGPKPLHTFCVHSDEVTCVAASVNLDVIISSSLDGTCSVHTLRYGYYVLSIPQPNHWPVHTVALSCEGYWAMYSKADKEQGIVLCDINGRVVKYTDPQDALNAITTTSDGRHLVTGGLKSVLTFWDIPSLQIVHTIDVRVSPITCVSLSDDNDHLLVGLKSGKLLVCTDPERSLHVLDAILDENFGID